MEKALRAAVEVFRAESSTELNLAGLQLLRRARLLLASDTELAKGLHALADSIESSSSPLAMWLAQPSSSDLLHNAMQQSRLPSGAQELVESLAAGRCPDVAMAERLIAQCSASDDYRGCPAHILALSVLGVCQRHVAAAALWPRWRDRVLSLLFAGESAAAESEVAAVLHSDATGRAVLCCIGLAKEALSAAVRRAVATALAPHVKRLALSEDKLLQSGRSRWRLDELVMEWLTTVTTGHKLEAFATSGHIAEWLSVARDAALGASSLLQRTWTMAEAIWHGSGGSTATEVKALVHDCIELAQRAVADENKTRKMVASVVGVIVRWLRDELLRVSVPDMRGVADTPLGRAQFEMASVALGELSTTARDVVIELRRLQDTTGELFVAATVERFSAAVSEFRWSYQLDTGLKLACDSGTGVCAVSNGSAHVAITVDARTLPPRLALHTLRFALGRVEPRVACTQGSAEAIYNWLLDFSASHISKAIQGRVLSLLAPKIEAWIRAANNFLSREWPQQQEQGQRMDQAPGTFEFFADGGFL